MNPSTKALDRYRDDAEFATIVDALVAFAMQHQFTPGELRDVAYVAAVKAEAMTIRPLIFGTKEES